MGKNIDIEEIDERTDEQKVLDKQAEFEYNRERLRDFAKPNCHKCYGTGRLGFINTEDGGKVAILCTAKGCALHQVQITRRLMQKEESRRKAEERENRKKEREERQVDTDEKENT